MKLAQTTLSKLRRSDLFVENRSAQDSQLRRSGIFNFVSRAEVAPTELENFLDAVATKIPRLRRFGGARLWSETQPQRVIKHGRVNNFVRAAAGALHTAALQAKAARN